MLIIISVLVIFVGLLLVPRQEKRAPTVTATNAVITGVSRGFQGVQRVHPSFRRPNASQTLTAEEIVANKVLERKPKGQGSQSLKNNTKNIRTGIRDVRGLRDHSMNWAG